MNTRSYAWYESPVGPLLLAGSGDGLAYVSFSGLRHAVSVDPHWTQEPSLFADAIQQLREDFAGQRKAFSLTLEPRGTEFQRAVWSEPTKVSFVRADVRTSPDRGLGHVNLNHSPSAAAIIVEAVSLDHYTAEHPAPDFLKCDVEGAELAVFEGAARLLRERHPILLVEMHSSENNRLLSEKFGELGYTCTTLDENHVFALPE